MLEARIECTGWVLASLSSVRGISSSYPPGSYEWTSSFTLEGATFLTEHGLYRTP
jgi:hypothetical protein